MENQNDFVTKSMFTEGIDHLARLVNRGFLEMERKMNDFVSKKDFRELIERVENLEKDMKGVYQRFDAVFIELREIKEMINEIDCRADVADLQLRVATLEKKVKLG